MANSLTSAEQQSLLWPITAKGAVMRWTPLGDPQVENLYHQAMEGGRHLERNIADANNWLIQKKIQLTNQVQSYTHMNSLAVDGQLPHDPRVPKFIADSISILQTANQLQKEITGLINALQQNITMLTAMVTSMLKMIQTALNSLANLLNNICNWGIPALPSIPNLLKDQIWNWNGFQFAPLALFAVLKSSVGSLISNTKFSFNFSPSQCSFGSTTPSNLFTGDPLTTQSYSGYTFGTSTYEPPLDGIATPAQQDLSDPAFIANMQALSATPQYSPTFNPNTEMFGAVPDSHQIIDNYQMPATTYTDNIVSISPQLRPNTVFTTDPDYSNPNYAVRNPQLRKDLIHFVNLADIVSSNYDPFVVSAWLIYLNLARAGRAGVWLPNFQAVYDQYLQPSISNLVVQPVPWNDVLGETNYEWMGTYSDTLAYVQNDVVVFNGVNYIALISTTGNEPDTNPTDWGTPPASVVYSDAPVIALITLFQSLPQNQLNHLLWQLSYIEAAILGYARNSTWDTNQDASYLSGPTGSDLDYVPTAITAAQSSLILGIGTAEFPVPITFPTAMKTTLDQVIAIATINIQNDLTYLSPRLGNRYTYNQFAVATQVDRFSQFWRDFATNLTNFLVQDPYLVQFAITYSEILDGAIDPLAVSSNVSAYQSLQVDVSSRNRSWVIGTPLLTIPIAPFTGNVQTAISPSTPDAPNVAVNGWIDSADLNPIAFLARPDIQALPIPMQIAMLRTNLSYAAVQKFKNDFLASVATATATANAILTATTQIGFQVEAASNPITATSITSNVLTVLVPNAYQTGNDVLLLSTAEAFLNGQVVTVITASATQFTAAFTNPDYNNLADTGTTGLVTYIPAGPTGAPIEFDTIDFDFTGNVTTLNPGLFTVQAAGQYSGIVQVNFEVPGAGTVTVSVLDITSSTVLATATATSTAAGPLTVSLSFNQQFNTDDVVQVVATSNFPGPSLPFVIGGSYFNLIQSAATGGTTTPTNANDEQRTYNLDVPFYITPPVPFMTIVQIDAAGNATPIDPTVPAITNVSITGNVLTITALNHLNPAGGDLVTFSGMGTANFLNGQVVTTTAATGTTFTAPFTHANYASTPDTGSVLYAIDASGAVLAPNPDGVMLTAGSQGIAVTVGVLYGGQYQIAGTGTFTAGALLYAGPDGAITQDYTTLITQVGWILCVGRVTAFDGSTNTITFIYEPHVPTRFSSMI